jgi:endonuclease-8
VPEGDTIHHAAARIRAVLVGRVPDELRAPSPRAQLERFPERLAGRALLAADAHGKHLLLRFEEGLTLHSHLRMTGSWAVYRVGQRWRRAPRRAWLVMRSGEREVVQFDGPVLELMSDARARRDPRLASLGQDVLGESFDHARFLRRLRAVEETRPVGEVILDQRVVAGIGNVWKAESCFAARVDPWRPVGRVSDEEAVAIVQFARAQMRESAALDGWSERPRAVYGRREEPCPRCGTPLRQRGQGDDNRTTFWCPGCQR